MNLQFFRQALPHAADIARNILSIAIDVLLLVGLFCPHPIIDMLVDAATRLMPEPALNIQPV